MAINLPSSGAALVAGAAVGVIASMPTIQKASPYAPGALAIAVGLAAAALSKNGPVSAAAFAAVGVGGVLIWEGYQASKAQAAATANPPATTTTSTTGPFYLAGADAHAPGFVQIQNPWQHSVIPERTNVGLRQSLVTPKGFGPLMPSTSQGMSGRRYVKAWNTMSP
jgi:hypothetical protein